jgi:hypothetical protein
MSKKFTWKKLAAGLMFGVLLAALTVTVIEYVYATTQTITATPSRLAFNGVGYLKSVYTFVNAKDTVWVPVNLVPNSQTATQAMGDTIRCALVIRTQRAKNAATAASIGVRWGYSMDGTNFTYATVGTDSTSWATAAGDSANSQGYRSWSTTTVNIGPTVQPAFWVPYNRVLIWGGVLGGSNGANVKVEAYVIPKF